MSVILRRVSARGYRPVPGQCLYQRNLAEWYAKDRNQYSQDRGSESARGAEKTFP